MSPPFCHSVIIPCRHSVIIPSHHSVVIPCRHSVKIPCCHSLIIPCNHSVIIPCHHAFVQSYSIMSFSHDSIPPCFHSSFPEIRDHLTVITHNRPFHNLRRLITRAVDLKCRPIFLDCEVSLTLYQYSWTVRSV